jgi:hypothetical protein
MTEVELPKVVAAAIKGKDGIIYHLPVPARHHDVGIWMIREHDHPIPFPGGNAQGFLMSDGTFGDRRYAKKCAMHHNQLLDRASNLIELYSEDVWYSQPPYYSKPETL